MSNTAKETNISEIMRRIEEGIDLQEIRAYYDAYFNHPLIDRTWSHQLRELHAAVEAIAINPARVFVPIRDHYVAWQQRGMPGIDVRMMGIVQAFNRFNGVTTTNCCEGHFEEGRPTYQRSTTLDFCCTSYGLRVVFEVFHEIRKRMEEFLLPYDPRAARVVANSISIEFRQWHIRTAGFDGRYNVILFNLRGIGPIYKEIYLTLLAQILQEKIDHLTKPECDHHLPPLVSAFYRKNKHFLPRDKPL